MAKLGALRLIACQGSAIEAIADEIKKLGADVAVIPGHVSDRPFADQLKEASVGVPLKGIILGECSTHVSDTTFMANVSKKGKLTKMMIRMRMSKLLLTLSGLLGLNPQPLTFSASKTLSARSLISSSCLTALPRS